LASKGVGVLTESGAYKALTLDLAESVGLELPALGDEDSPALRAALPPFVPVSNPADLTAQALVDPDLYGRAIEALLDDDRIGAIVLAIIQTDNATCDLKLPAIIRALERRPITKPVIYAGLDDGAVPPGDYLREMRALGASCIPTGERAVRALARLVARKSLPAPAAKPRKRLSIELPEGAGIVPEFSSKEILRVAGVPFVDGALATSTDEAIAVAERIGYPVVLKAQSEALPHKTEAGGVLLNLSSSAEVEAGWRAIHARVAAYAPDLKLDGLLVERMSGKGIEMIVGAKRDPSWGPVLLIGFGGVQAEVLKDFCILAPDLAPAEIEAELLRLRGAPLLQGFRGAPPAALGALAAAAGKLGQLMQQEPRITEIDLNPVVVHSEAEGISVLDALMELGP
jgi:acyl-CoA synthetase (NDP forming)